MNKYWTSLMAGVLAVCTIASCTGQKSDSSEVAATDSVAASVASDSASTLAVVTAESTLSWKGFKPGGEHFGTIPVATGSVSLSQGKLASGEVSIQMNGIEVLDLKDTPDMAAKLKGHLESEDFFEVAKYPEAKFVLTDLPEGGLDLAQVTELKGNLTLKDVTKNITIPVDSVAFDVATKTFTLKSKAFKINRADWNVKYGSKSFFKGLGDKFINDDIELSFALIAR